MAAVYHGEPPRLSRDLLFLALGYRLQEIEHGGLGKSTRRALLARALPVWRRTHAVIDRLLPRADADCLRRDPRALT